VWVVSKDEMGSFLHPRILLQKKKEMKGVMMVEYQILLLQE
jgi:hypothetical protein